MDVSILQEAFEKVYKQSPAPMQVAEEVASTLHQSLNESSAHTSSILDLFDKTVDCNNQSTMDIGGYEDKRVPVVKLKRLDITEKDLSNCQKLFLWIIKPIPNSYGICVEGKRSLEDDDFWHSGMVTTRYSSTVIGTSSGSIYELNGEIELMDALDAGIPEILAQQFKSGFPTNWDDLVDEYLPSNIVIGNSSVLTNGPLESNTFVSQQVQAVVPRQQENFNKPVQNSSCLDEVAQENEQPLVVEQDGDTNISNSNVTIGNKDQVVNSNQDVSVQDNLVNEIYTESEVTDSILNQTMVDKDIIDNNGSILPLLKRKSKTTDDILEDVDTQDRTPFASRQKRLTSADEKEDDENENQQYDLSTVSTSDISYEAPKSQPKGKPSKKTLKEVDAGAECHRSYENMLKVKERMKDPLPKGKGKKSTQASEKSKGPTYKKSNKMTLTSDTSESEFGVSESVPDTNDTSEIEIETVSRKPAKKTTTKKVASAMSKTLSKQSSKVVQNQDASEDDYSIVEDVVPQKSLRVTKMKNTQIEKLKKATSIASKQSVKSSAYHDDPPVDVEIASASSADDETQVSECSDQVASVSRKDKSKKTKPAVPLLEWIIRPFPKTKGVIVEGKRRGEDGYWRSSSIAERKDARTIITDRGSTYKLVGTIEKLDAIDAGFSPGIVKAFTNGFPKKWNELIEKHYISEERSDYGSNGSMNVSSVSTKTSKKTVTSPSEVLNGTVVGTPSGQFVDISHLRTTKSGRVVKPVLANWAGQKVVYDSSSKQMKVVYNSKFGESFFKDQCIQMSAKTSRTSSLRKKLPPSGNKSQILDSSKMDSLNKKPNPSNNHIKLSKVMAKKNSASVETNQNDDETVHLERDIRNIIDKNKKKRLKDPPKSQTCYSNNDKMDDDDDDDDVMTSPSSRTRSRLHEQHAKSEMRKKRKSENRTESDSDIDYIDSQPKRSKSSNETQAKNSKTSDIANNSEIDKQSKNMKSKVATRRKNSKIFSKVNDNEVESDIDVDDQAKQTKSSIGTRHRNSKMNSKARDNKLESDSENDDEICFKQTSKTSETKSQPMSKSLTSKNEKSQVLKSISSPVKKVGIRSRVKQTDKVKGKSNTVKKNRVEISSSETDQSDIDDDSWGKSEIIRLQSALKCISQYDDYMWKRIAEAVDTRSVKECQEYMESHHQYQSFLQNAENSKRTKSSKRIEITAKKGTMKRRKQIREFLEQGIEGGEEPDLFDSTPFRTKTKKTIVPRLDEDVFSTETDYPITPGTNCRTPSMKYYQAQFSARKTPADCIVSPANTAVNNAKADKIVHHYLKRRKMVKTKTTKKDSSPPKLKPNKPRTLFGADGNIDESIFQNSDPELSDDEEEERDHYMSDGSVN